MKVSTAKQTQILTDLRHEILSGRWSLFTALPSENALARRFGVSRMTTMLVMRDLESQGLVTRVQGRGTFVTRSALSRRVGLIVPGLADSEFYPAVVDAILKAAQAMSYELRIFRVDSEDRDIRAHQALRFADKLVKEGTSGVIYQPLDSTTDAASLNGRVLSVFSAAHVPVVLLDYDVVQPPDRSVYDVVGINNPDAGYRLAWNLISVGARKIDFLMRPDWAPSIVNRLRGVKTAVANGGRSCRCRVLLAEPDDVRALRRHLRQGRPDAFVCGNDTHAAIFKQTLEKVGLTVPGDVLLAGFDDVKLAALLTPPLTTIRNPCAEIGAKAFGVLIARMARPDAPSSDVFLPAPLVVRESTARIAKKST